MEEFVFGPFVLRTDTPRLTRDGADVRLRPLAFEALRVLLQHRGEIVGYDALIAEAWSGTHVSRHTVDVTLGDVRRCLAECGPWLVHHSRAGYALSVPASDALVREGWHLWHLRTLTGCERAIESFSRAIAENPPDGRAFEGLSASYLALAVFGMRSPLEMHAKFLEAHERAVALSGLRPELRSDRGFDLNLIEQRPHEAESEFLAALEDRPSLMTTYPRLAMLYASQRRFDESLAIVERGKTQDSLFPTLAAAETLVHCWRRDFATAVAVGRQAVELHPYLQVIRVNYAQALQFAGRPDEAIGEYQIASILSPDVLWLRAFEGACQALLGRRSEGRAMLEGLEAIRRSQYVDAYHMSVLRSAMGQTSAAIAELERAFSERSVWIYTLDVDPQADPLRDQPAFQRVLERLQTQRSAPVDAGPPARSPTPAPPVVSDASLGG